MKAKVQLGASRQPHRRKCNWAKALDDTPAHVEVG
jgi:hypothetical protein